MDKDHRFPFLLDFEGQRMRASVTPSDEKNDSGQPVYFRVELNGQFFAYLCCNEDGWYEKDSSGKPKTLVDAIGKAIHDYYD